MRASGLVSPQFWRDNCFADFRLSIVARFAGYRLTRGELDVMAARARTHTAPVAGCAKHHPKHRSGARRCRAASGAKSICRFAFEVLTSTDIADAKPAL